VTPSSDIIEPSSANNAVTVSPGIALSIKKEYGNQEEGDRYQKHSARDILLHQTTSKFDSSHPLFREGGWK
jgi:hypothetical protein